MSYAKYIPPDHVATAAHVAKLKSAGPSRTGKAMARGGSITLAERDPAEELDAEIKVRKRLNRHGHRWEPDPRDPSRRVEVCPDADAHAADVEAIGDMLQALGLLPEPESPAVEPVRDSRGVPVSIGPRARECGLLVDGGLSVEAASLRMGIGLSCAQDYVRQWRKAKERAS